VYKESEKAFAKNKRCGDAALAPKRIFSKLDACQATPRRQDKPDNEY
jgi:hypothetical protein